MVIRKQQETGFDGTTIKNKQEVMKSGLKLNYQGVCQRNLVFLEIKNAITNNTKSDINANNLPKII
jgi:hypothetical protein